jgi:hypothetical protein
MVDLKVGSAYAISWGCRRQVNSQQQIAHSRQISDHPIDSRSSDCRIARSDYRFPDSRLQIDDDHRHPGILNAPIFVE